MCFGRCKIVLILLWLLWGIGPAWGGGSVLFILDSSGSMAGKLDGQVKMDAAKSAFKELLAAMPPGVNVGLEVYGHHGDRDCSVIELVNPVAPLNSEAIISQVEKLVPKRGATPMAAALEKGGEALSSIKGPKAIVLISDGKENCGGDPAAVANRLKSQGIGVVTHVVGLGVNEEEKQQLAAIAAAGGGEYYAANSAGELRRSLAAIKKKVITSHVIFHDDFDGETLAAEWEVVNPDSESAILEDGAYRIVTEVPNGKLFNAKNMLFYRGELPKEYEAEVQVAMTQMEWCKDWWNAPFIGLLLKKDDDNGILLVSGIRSGCGSEDGVHYSKVKGGKWEPGYSQSIGKPKKERRVRLMIRRMKRQYEGRYSLDDGKTWKSMGSFTVLRPRYELGIIAARGDGKTHPMLNYVDWFELRRLER